MKIEYNPRFEDVYLWNVDMAKYIRNGSFFVWRKGGWILSVICGAMFVFYAQVTINIDGLRNETVAYMVELLLYYMSFCLGYSFMFVLIIFARISIKNRIHKELKKNISLVEQKRTIAFNEEFVEVETEGGVRAIKYKDISSVNCLDSVYVFMNGNNIQLVLPRYINGNETNEFFPIRLMKLIITV